MTQLESAPPPLAPPSLAAAPPAIDSLPVLGNGPLMICVGIDATRCPMFWKPGEEDRQYPNITWAPDHPGTGEIRFQYVQQNGYTIRKFTLLTGQEYLQMVNQEDSTVCTCNVPSKPEQARFMVYFEDPSGAIHTTEDHDHHHDPIIIVTPPGAVNCAPPT